MLANLTTVHVLLSLTLPCDRWRRWLWSGPVTAPIRSGGKIMSTREHHRYTLSSVDFLVISTSNCRTWKAQGYSASTHNSHKHEHKRKHRSRSSTAGWGRRDDWESAGQTIGDRDECQCWCRHPSTSSRQRNGCICPEALPHRDHAARRGWEDATGRAGLNINRFLTHELLPNPTTPLPLAELKVVSPLVTVHVAWFNAYQSDFDTKGHVDFIYQMIKM